jgi:large subunit ribosomal protein L22
MQVKASYRYARISAFKCREVTREIQGRPVAAALDIVAFSPKKAATLVQKTLKSAVANADDLKANNAAFKDLNVGNLVVKEAVVGEAPTIKRFRAKARGSAGSIRKRTSHIFITLTDEVEIKQRAAKKTAAKKSTRTSGRKKAAPKSQENNQE